MTPTFRVPDLPQASIGAFRSEAEAGNLLSRVSPSARRLTLPLPFRIERRIKDFLTMAVTKKEREKELKG